MPSSKISPSRGPARGAAPATSTTIDVATPLLGGLSPAQFMRRYWQKKPLLIRQAWPGVQPPVDRAGLFALAQHEDVESRLIVQTTPKTLATKGKAAKGKEAAGWKLRHGPFASRRALPAFTQPGWTLLVQGLDLHVPAAHEMMSRFRFVPDARLDDLMMSYATDGGGVGPHYDSYDVFLLQVQGRRRWRIGPLKNTELQPDVPLKILSRFEPEEEWVLEPGDMLYLPPRWAHDGVAEGECMTCSIGFRVPEEAELAREVLLRWVENLANDARPRLYRDPGQPATASPGAIPAALQGFAEAAVREAMQDQAGWMSALGEVLSEPKPRVWFDAGLPLPDGVGVRLDPKTRMLYDEHCVYANGESWRAAGKDARQLRALADGRRLSAGDVAKASTALRALLDQWAEDGWLHPDAG